VLFNPTFLLEYDLTTRELRPIFMFHYTNFLWRNMANGQETTTSTGVCKQPGNGVVFVSMSLVSSIRTSSL
jgi:hypothetical protein